MRSSSDCRQYLGVIGCAIVVSTMTAACASGMGDKLVGQPCTRSDQCAVSLVCSRGSCVATSRDGGKSDATVPEEDAGGKGGIGK